MSKRIGRVILLIIVLVACLNILGACNDEVDAPDVVQLVYDDLNKIGFESGEINEESSSVDIVVKNDVSSLSLSFLQDSDTGKTTYTAYSDENCTNEISDLTLSVGENVFYVVGSTKTNSVVVKVSVTREEPPHTEHTYGDWKETEAATCIAPGIKERTCTVCGDKQTEAIVPLGHSPKTAIKENTVDTTCQKAGSYDSVVYCERCNQELSRTTITENALGHNYEGGVCTQCGDRLYTRVDASGGVDTSGDYIYFGTYPQTCVTDDETQSVLTALAGELPEEGDESKGGWTSYGYYIENSLSHYMWYIDLGYNGEKYRGVYFTKSRPFWIALDSNSGNSHQGENGYETSTVYWFRYDPIKWKIIREENGEALILCEMIIDGQDYYYQQGNGKRYRTAVENYNDDYYSGKGSTVSDDVFDSNYQYSTIRQWLNETFYDIAFIDQQKALIQAHTVKNDTTSMTDTGNNFRTLQAYACDDTQDKIFLLSEYEVTDSSNGFGAFDSCDNERCKKATDYAKCQGTYIKTGDENGGNGLWLLRSPNCFSTCTVGFVNYDGSCESKITYTNYTTLGIVPALHIKLIIAE